VPGNRAPAITYLEAQPNSIAVGQEARLVYAVDDPDGDALSYDVSLVYADGRVLGLAAGLRANSLSIPTSRIPGGKGLALDDAT
jgi:hypothetical protein